ncbi:MAG: hypothetical protein A2882_13515 [Phenylobacterium sp. RIFCSPHIGHO2_01_FULL_70_10]|nr:MAG: hypothetical protein A2882_13515 [Phenylobacterium sp. RIFCSPHIGHO2_01_FULL_70_10]
MSQRHLTIALFVSLALNLFAVGAIVGGLVVGARFSQHRQTLIRPGPPPFWDAAQTLPAAQQEAFHRALRGDALEVRRKLMAAGEARREAWSELGADPFDPTAVRRDLARAQAMEMEARSIVEGRVVDFAGELSAEERDRLAGALSRPATRRMHGGRREADEERGRPPREPAP